MCLIHLPYSDMELYSENADVMVHVGSVQLTNSNASVLVLMDGCGIHRSSVANLSNPMPLDFMLPMISGLLDARLDRLTAILWVLLYCL